MTVSVYNQIYTALFCYHFTHNTVDSRGNQSYFKKYVGNLLLKTMHLTTNKEREKGRKGVKSKGEQKVKKTKGKKRIKGKKEREKKEKYKPCKRIQNIVFEQNSAVILQNSR